MNFAGPVGAAVVAATVVATVSLEAGAAGAVEATGADVDAAVTGWPAAVSDDVDEPWATEPSGVFPSALGILLAAQPESPAAATQPRNVRRDREDTVQVNHEDCPTTHRRALEYLMKQKVRKFR